MSKRLLVLGVVALAALLATSSFAANRGVSFDGISYIHPYEHIYIYLDRDEM